MKYFLFIIFFTAIFVFLMWNVGDKNQENNSYISPLPDFLVLDKNNQVTFLDLWFPFMANAYGKGTDIPEMTAKYVLVYDLSTDKVVYEKNPRKKTPMASITKIMTAIIAMENHDGVEYQVAENDIVGFDSMGLEEGEILSKEELLYGLLLPSGNDAAEVLARNYPDGGREGFLKAMNDKAKTLGLENTRFSNPSGLQGDGVQYTTAYDLLVITRYALENFSLFRDIVATPYYEIAATDNHKAYELYNSTNLLTTYPGVKGVKTGYTPEAGYCLITYLDYEGHKIIAVLLDSEDRKHEMKELLDYSLRKLVTEPPEYTGE